MVVLTGPPANATVLARQRVDLLLPDHEGPPFHTAAGRSRDDAERLIGRYEAAARDMATTALAAAVEEHGVGGVGVCLGSGRRPPEDLGRVLAVHAMQHSAEGWLYRDAVLDAAAELGLPTTGAPDADLDEAWATALGKGLGPPWAKDQKLAAAVAREALN
jgi:hypothetical protein